MKKSKLSHFRRCATVVCIVAPTALTSACMLSPYDGQVVASISSPVSVSGNMLFPSAMVAIRANGTRVGTTFTGASPIRFEGRDWYSFGTDVTIPQSVWRRGRKGGAAAAMSIAGGSFSRTYAVNRDYVACYQRVGATRFLSECTAPYRGTAWIYTAAYPAGVDLILDSIQFDPSDRAILLTVYNTGEVGDVDRFDCGPLGVLVPSEIANVRPTYNQTFRFSNLSSWPPAKTGSCTVYGTNKDGSPETIDGDNLLQYRIR